MTIIKAIHDENLIRSFLANKKGSIGTWGNWCAAIRLLYGLPLSSKRWPVAEQCTGREYGTFKDQDFDAALFLTGRRSGKSRIAAVIGAYEGALAGHEEKLAKGEVGVVPVFAPSKKQARIVRGYLRAIFETPLLQREVIEETKEGFTLRNGNLIEILAGDFRTARGYTLLAAIVDEIAFFGLDDDAKVKSDTELVRAIRPSLATTGGKLVCISSPYARKGWCFRQHQKNFGNAEGKILVWNSPSRTMNPTLPQSVVDDAMEDDLQAAKSEYLGEFRDDISIFLPRDVITRLVAPNRTELLPNAKTRYVAFADLSGGRGDDAALAIAHRTTDAAMFVTQKDVVVVDLLRRYRPPFNPQDVVQRMCSELRRFNLKRVVGDNYAAEFVAGAFQSCGMIYTRCEKPKGQLYVELLPRLCSGEIELLDDPVCINQLASLERRTRSGGRDIIDHPPSGHDDLANAIAGVAVEAAKRVLTVGAFR